MTAKATRQESFDAIGREREYQAKFEHAQPTARYLNLIGKYASIAKCMADGPGRVQYFRIIGALAVAAMEEHGAIDR